jgi:hypothetical protein
MRSEANSRREPFLGGEAITLGDGRPWYFPKPKVGSLPQLGEDGEIRFDRARRSFGPEYDAKVDVYLEAEDGVGELNALCVLAVDLLGRNYELSVPERLSLLPRWFDDDTNTDMWRAIADVALGRSPKPIPVG